MPELPEVETIKCGITPHVVGKKVVKVVVRNGSLRWPVSAGVNSFVAGKTLVSIQRRGKYLLFEFSSGFIIWHLGMSGSLRIVSLNIAVTTHDHIDVVFSGGVVLRYHDPRRFGCVLWNDFDDCLEKHRLLRHLGPEPLSSEFCGEYLFDKSRKRQIPIKTLIMDSKIVVGVGNIYANEALFLSRIHPLKQAAKISRRSADRLVEEIKCVLQKAISCGGTTLRDFVNSDGRPGYFKQELNVYGRAGKPCKNCGKELLEKRVSQRSTVYCTGCQR